MGGDHLRLVPRAANDNAAFEMPTVSDLIAALPACMAHVVPHALEHGDVVALHTACALVIGVAKRREGAGALHRELAAYWNALDDLLDALEARDGGGDGEGV